jgi:gluconate kinase
MVQLRKLDAARPDMQLVRRTTWLEEEGHGGEDPDGAVRVEDDVVRVGGRLGRPQARDILVSAALVKHLRSFVYFKKRDQALLETLRSRARVFLTERKMLAQLQHLIPGSVAYATVPGDQEIAAIRYVMRHGSRLHEVNAALQGSAHVPGNHLWWELLTTGARWKDWKRTFTDWWTVRSIPVA